MRTFFGDLRKARNLAHTQWVMESFLYGNGTKGDFFTYQRSLLKKFYEISSRHRNLGAQVFQALQQLRPMIGRGNSLKTTNTFGKKLLR